MMTKTAMLELVMMLAMGQGLRRFLVAGSA
jgi:hypothetical protein